jgi:hypothetical protein
MPVNYQQLFTYLVGEVNDSLREIEEAMDQKDCGKEELMSIGVKLRSAMLTVNEMRQKGE